MLMTERDLQAIELCKECLVLLNSIALGEEDQFTIQSIILINDTMMSAYFNISDYTNAERCARKLLFPLHDFGDTKSEGQVRLQLAKILRKQRKFEDARKQYEIAIGNMKTIGERVMEANGYISLGIMLKSLGEYQKAKDYFEKALAIQMQIGDKGGEAATYVILGAVLISLGEYQKAKEYCEKALAIQMQIGDKEGEAAIYVNLGKVLVSLGEYQKAKEYCEKALAIQMQIGNEGGEATAYGNLGNVLASLGEYQKAKEYCEKALAIQMQIGDKGGEAAIYVNLGNVLASLGEYQKAKEYCEKALAIQMQIGDKKGEAAAYGNLGNVLASLGECQKAKEYHEKALAIQMQIGDKGGEAIAYGNLGNVLRSLGEYQKAKEYHGKALAIQMQIGDKKGEAAAYGNLGNVLESLGEYQKAKEYYEKALAIIIKTGERSGQKAKEYYEKALAIQMQIGDKRGEATTYANLGNVLRSLHEDQKAKEYYEKSLAITMQIYDKGREVGSYINLGSVLQSLGEYQKAKEYYEKALANIIEVGNRSALALLYLKLGSVSSAREKYLYGEKALSIATEIGDRERQAGAFHLLGEFFLWRKDYQKAIECYRKQLAINGEICNREGLARSYLNLGFVSLNIGESERAEEYLEKVRWINSDMGVIDLELSTLCLMSMCRRFEPRSKEAYLYLYQYIAEHEAWRNSQQGNEQFQLDILEFTDAPYKRLSRLLSFAGNLRDALYVEELTRARCLADLVARNFSIENHISADPQSWYGMEEIVNKERDSAFLYISYDDRRVFLWVLKANGDILFRYSEEVDDKTLMAENAYDLNTYFNKSIRGFGVLPRQKCEDRSLTETMPILTQDESEADLRGEKAEDTERMLSECFKLIIAPVAELLTEPEIIIVPERNLYRVPFVALRDQPGGKSLAETYRLRIVPSLTTLRLIQNCPADYHNHTGALVVGSPKVGRARYRGKIHNFASLTGARKEAEMIGQLLGVQPLLGERATREAVLQEISSVSLIHIAAHGNADRGEIALSPCPTAKSIPEEEDYLLRIADISQVKLRAKLVVLSCCHSGRGEIKVEGVIGIARAFLASGARSVLVTLWAIEDKATEQFMNRFYRHLVDGFSASECLHQAMKWLRK
ncbi:Tetratricopeptide repeat protein 28 [Stylophora pistillata]|uniref:Tetratricopeptide repeat protein 28 n=1 Tax=Stylophora pistillata TaxID=50429 RepID=A0A2B4R5I9_STYPI|nr:Tetratricopeptide repeat protein 28 [Stylophora pistillata]